MKLKHLATATFCLMVAFGCSSEKDPIYKDASADIEVRVNDLVNRMTLEEKILQLNQYVLGVNTVENNFGEVVKDIPVEIGSLIYFNDHAEVRNAMQKKAMEESRLGIPILFGHDVIHGYRTTYPIPLALACSWNPELVRQASEVAAQEAYACGVNWTFSPMVDVSRDPRWGRVMECFGEDPYANAVFCEAVVKGYQGDDLSEKNRIAACLKHYVGYGASEAGRDYVPTEISDQTLWDTYLPPFEAGVKAGAATLMSAFHTISGIPASANHYILTEVLKDKWQHDGFVVSDWGAVEQLRYQGMAEDEKEATMLAFNAGIEMDMADRMYQKYLKELLDEGKVNMKQVDESVRRILRVKFRLGLFETPYVEEKPESEIYLLPKSLEVAEQAAAESMVLLKNEGSVLPLENVGTIAVIGPVANDSTQHLGNWGARARAEDVVGIIQGMNEEYAGKSKILTAKGCDFEGDDKSGFAEAVRVAKASDVVVVCLGHKGSWSGENQSRSTIEIPQIQEELLAAVEATGKPIVVLVTTGRPVELPRIEKKADAILQTWHSGIRAGKAIAGLLSGRYNPSGKLAMTFPYSTGQIPIYYNRRHRARTGDQGLYKDITSEPMYPFAHGLSYSTFEYGKLIVSADQLKEGETIMAEVTVKNTSKRDGLETVHWFIKDPYSHITRPVKELKHFEKKLIKAGESTTFRFEIDPLRDLGFVNREGKRYLDKGEYRIMVGDQSVTIHVI
ncbi:MAG: glycoside hydrolase family 3 C-terminal domain-containing protein [Bacteroides sp.]|nr:glycoside hydrolase family 3 C-terminal domain-containing protein [Bacteroides sp.]